MATAATRANPRVNPPLYKDYVNFLAGYKSGKKDDDLDSGISVKSLSNSSSNTSSSSLNSDVTDFSKSNCTPFNTYLETSKNKKFESVRPKFEEKAEVKMSAKTEEKTEPKTEERITKKSEIVIEIQPGKSVSEVSKLFEQKDPKMPTKSYKMNSKINIFEKQISVENKPKIANKPAFCKSPSPKIDTFNSASPPPLKVTSPPPMKPASPPPEPMKSISVQSIETKPLPLPPPMPTEVKSVPPPPPMPSSSISSPKSFPVTNGNILPPPPPFVNTPQPVKIQATLTKGPQTKYTVNSQNGVIPEIDRNDPMVKKLVYGTLRGLYGAYHDKATDMLATLPKNMVVRSNGVRDRIEQIAANGDLDKLNGRVNPKLEQE